MLDHIAVVGASLAGLRTIEALRREGFEGRITVIGAEDALPYDRPPLSKQFLTDDWDEEKLALARDGVDGLNAEWRLGCSATALDAKARRLTLADGDCIEADAIVLATGTRAKRLPFGRDLSGVLELRTLEDARALRERLAEAKRAVVVGAGFIGMEVAASCRKKGLEVTVVEPLPAPLIRGLGRTLGERVARTHRDEGVEFRLGVGVEGFEGEDRVTGVVLEGGDVLPADVVVVGVGAAPAVDWLDDAGLEIDDGILCDATGETGIDGVYALGDCARWENPRNPDRPRIEHWTGAVEQSSVVAEQILTGKAEPYAPIPYVWTDQFHLRIAMAGEIDDEADMHVVKGTIEDDQFLALFARDGQVVGAVGFKRPRQLNALRKKMAGPDGLSLDDALAEFGD